MRRFLLLGLTSIACGACVLSSARSEPPTLLDGGYQVDATVTGGTCWSTGVDLPVAATVAVSGTAVRITTELPVFGSTTLLPTMTGTWRGGWFDVGGSGETVLSSGCGLAVTDAAHGAPGEPPGTFAADLALTLAADPPTPACESTAAGWTVSSLAAGSDPCDASVLAVGSQ